VQQDWVSEYGGRNFYEAIAEGFATMKLCPDMAKPLEQRAYEILTRKEPT